MGSRHLLSCFITLCSAAPLSAMAADSVDLGSMVVTASGYTQRIADAPASVSIITREELERRPFRNLEDAVRGMEGISVVGGDPNNEDIVIRGMPGEYTLILVDGRRQGTRETMNRGTGGVQASLIPPLAAIERIEVVRGPMSALYGSDAMGGVINIITRKNTDQWRGSLTTGYTRPDGREYGDTFSNSVWLSGPLVKDLLSVQLYGSLNERKEDEIFYPANFTAGTADTDDDNVGVTLTLTPSSAQEISLGASRTTFEMTNTPGKTFGLTEDSLRNRHERDNWFVAHQGTWNFGTSNISLSQERAKMIDWWAGVKDDIQPELTNTYLDADVTLPLNRHMLTLGTQWVNAELEGVANQDNVAGYTNTDSVERESWSVFAEDMYQLTDNFTLTAGVRLDDYDGFGQHITPRLYGNYQLTPEWTLRAGVAQGFKAPTLRQVTADYCMTTGGSSLPRGPLCGNPDLEPEESTTQEIGIRYDGTDGRAFGLTLFNNDFENKVVSYDSGTVDPIDPSRPLYVYDNIDEVRIRGIELSGALPLHPQWKLSGNYTYTDSERRGGGEPSFDGSSLDGKPLDKTPEHVANLRLEWEPLDRVSAYASANYLGKQYYTGFRNGAVNSRERGSSTTFDLGSTYQLTQDLSLSAAVLNVTDRIVAVDERGRFEGLDGNWMVDEGRRYWVSATVSF